MRKKGLALLLLAALLALQTGSALASVPYRTFTLGVDGNLVQTQAAYEPIRAMTRFGETTLKNPADLRMGPDGNRNLLPLSGRSPQSHRESAQLPLP